MSCGVGRRCGSDLALLQLWCRSVAIAPIRPLAWESSYAVDAALKSKKKKKKNLINLVSLQKRNPQRQKKDWAWVPTSVHLEASSVCTSCLYSGKVAAESQGKEDSGRDHGRKPQPHGKIEAIIFPAPPAQD